MTAALHLVPTEPRYTLLSGHPASDHQATIFDVAADPKSGSKMIIAVPGSGKTTTAKNMLRYLPAGAHVQGVSFGKDTAQALKDALAELTQNEIDSGGDPLRYKNVRMGTIHSVCYGAVCRFLGVKSDQLKPNTNKIRNILKARLTEDDHALYSAFVKNLVEKAKGEGIGCLIPDTEERWYDLVDHYGLYLDSDEATIERGIEIARKVLIYSIHLAKAAKNIDFDDMPYLVVLWKIRLWQNDVVILDEEQDTNPIGRACVHLMLRKGGRLFAYGDPKQSIYGFRGASVDATDRIRSDFGATDLPLTVSYRCARAIVRHAQQWIPYMEPSEFAEEGSVEWMAEEDGLAGLTADDAVLCRQTAPLITLAYRQIAKGRGCRVLGREIGEGLVALVKAQRAKGLDRLVEKLTAYREREMAGFIAKGEETKAEAVADRVECVMVSIRALPETERTVPALERRIMALFEVSGQVLTLATQHKSKGLEWPTVAILRPDLNPSRAARQEWEHEQEENLQVVAATRAKSRLIYMER